MSKTLLLNIAADPSINLGEGDYLFANLLEVQKRFQAQIDSGELDIRTFRLDLKKQADASKERSNNQPTDKIQLNHETPIFDLETVLTVLGDTDAEKIIVYGHGHSTFQPMQNVLALAAVQPDSKIDSIEPHFSTHKIEEAHTVNAAGRLVDANDLLLHTTASEYERVYNLGQKWRHVEHYVYTRIFSTYNIPGAAANYEKMLATPEGQQVDDHVQSGGKVIISVPSAGFSINGAHNPVSEEEAKAAGRLLAETFENDDLLYMVVSAGPRANNDTKAGQNSFAAHVQGIREVNPNAKVVEFPFDGNCPFDATKAALHLQENVVAFSVNAEGFGLAEAALGLMPASVPVVAVAIHQMDEANGVDNYSATHASQFKNLVDNKGLQILGQAPKSERPVFGRDPVEEAVDTLSAGFAPFSPIRPAVMPTADENNLG